MNATKRSTGFVNIKRYNSKWLRNYVMIISSIVALVATTGLLSFFLDFGGQFSDLGFFVLGICVLVGYVYVRRWVRVINNTKAQSFVYVVFVLGVFLSSVILSNVTHELRHPMVEFTTMHDAIQSNEENIRVKNVEIDTSRHSVFTTYRLIERRHRLRPDIEHIAFVTYKIKNEKNVFWGYKQNSDIMSLRDREKYDIFVASLDGKIKSHAIPNGEGYYRRVMSNMEDYDAFLNACRDIDSSIESPVIFMNLKCSPKDNINSEITMILIVIFASIFIILLVFLFVKSDITPLSINKEIKQERSQIITYIRNRDNWPHILLIILIVGYFLMMLIGGYKDFYGEIDAVQMQQWGALSNYLCIDRCELWRLLTFPFVHVRIYDLVGSLMCLLLFLFLSFNLLHSWLLWIVFFSTSVAVGLVFIILYPHDMLFGAYGGIMGLCGYRIGKGIDILIDDMKKQRRKKKKKKANIVEMLFVLIGLEGFCIALPSIIFSLILGANQTVIITGLLFGIVMWSVIKNNWQTEAS